jgi:histidinol-phosphatase (PHP family)
VSPDEPSTINQQLFSDYHTHPQGHRVQRYSQNILQPWVESARARGLTDLAFTDHDRFHAGVDFDELDKLRAANPDVKIRAGIELDNDPQTSGAGRNWVEQNWDKLDFVLGSVHYLDDPNQMFDTLPDGAGQFVGRDVNEVYEDYFRRIREITATGLVDCLSHLDLIKSTGIGRAGTFGQLSMKRLSSFAPEIWRSNFRLPGGANRSTNFIRVTRSFSSR